MIFRNFINIRTILNSIKSLEESFNGLNKSLRVFGLELQHWALTKFLLTCAYTWRFPHEFHRKTSNTIKCFWFGVQNRIGRETVNRHIFCFGFSLYHHCILERLLIEEFFLYFAPISFSTLLVSSMSFSVSFSNKQNMIVRETLYM